MAKYRITDPQTGRTVTVSGDTPPNEQQIREIFSAVGGGQQQTQMFSQIPDKTGAVTDALRGAAGAFRGNAAEDLPTVSELGKVDFRTFGAAMLGDDEDYANALRLRGANIREDAAGNPIATFSDGAEGYVNQPGMDPEDLLRFGGKAAMFLPATRWGQSAATMTGKAALTGAGAAVTDAGMQAAGSTAGGRTDVDPGQTALTFFAGMAAEYGAPLLKYAAKLVGAFKQPNAEAGRALAADLKIPGAGSMSDDEAIALARAAQNASPEVRPEALVAESQGLRPNLAQQTDDYWRENTLAMERSTGRDAYNRQVAQVSQNLDEYGRRIGGAGRDEGDVLAMRGLKSAADDAHTAASRAYDEAAQAQGSIRGEAFDDLFARMDRVADENWLRGAHNQPVYPSGQAVLGNIDNLKSQVQSLRANPNVVDYDAPFQAVENFRQSLVAARQQAKGADARNVGLMMDEFDSWLDDTFDQALINGDDAFLSKAKDARKLWAHYKQNFAERNLKKGSDSFGRKMEMFVNGDIDERQMADFVLGVGNNIKADTAMQFAKRMRSALPKKNYDQFVQGLIDRLVINPGGKEFTLPALENRLAGFLYGRKYKELADTVLTPQQIDELKRLHYGIKGLIPDSPASRQQARDSGTAQRLFTMLKIDQAPFASRILDMMNESRWRQLYDKPSILQAGPSGAGLAGRAALPAVASQ